MTPSWPQMAFPPNLAPLHRRVRVWMPTLWSDMAQGPQKDHEIQTPSGSELLFTDPYSIRTTLADVILLVVSFPLNGLMIEKMTTHLFYIGIDGDTEPCRSACLARWMVFQQLLPPLCICAHTSRSQAGQTLSQLAFLSRVWKWWEHRIISIVYY